MDENRIISINVGGEIFTSTTAIIQSLPGTLLAHLVEHHVGSSESTNQQVPSSTSKYPYAPHPFNTPVYTYDDPNTDLQGDAQEQDRWADRMKFVHVRNNRHSDTLSRPQSQTSKRSGGDVNGRRSSHGSHQDDKPRRTPSAHEAPVLFIDRNPVLMPYILDAYRMGTLHLPSGVCSMLIRTELAFWGLSEDLIGACCWKAFHEGLARARIIGVIHKSLYDKFDVRENRDNLTPVQRIWLAMERPSYSLGAKVWCAIYYMAIATSVMCFVLSSVADYQRINEKLRRQYDDLIASNETISLVRYMSFFVEVEGLSICSHLVRTFFTIEFTVRLFTTPSKRSFVRNPHNITDSVILLVSWVKFVLDQSLYEDPEHFSMVSSYVTIILNCVMAIQVLRVGHLFKHMASLKLIYLSTKESAAELLLLFVVVGVAVLLFGTSMFLVETLSDTDLQLTFMNVPIAMWWAIITMTTVGYGDFVPKSPAGYAIGVICALAGLLLVAMPIAIIARNFSEYYDSMTSRDQYQRREQFLAKVKTLKERKGGPDGSPYKSGQKSTKSNPLKRKMNSSNDDVMIISSNGIGPDFFQDALEMKIHNSGANGKASSKGRLDKVKTFNDPGMINCWT